MLATSLTLLVDQEQLNRYPQWRECGPVIQRAQLHPGVSVIQLTEKNLEVLEEKEDEVVE